VNVLGFSSCNYLNNQCYDLDRKNVAKGFTTSTFNIQFKDNNVGFTFQAAVKAEETK
jgi:hypothetical protein